ncbi:MAG: hypothetical protein HY321_22520 [Armatimonadetes bacterium]|nr:hypothetical protein [Armatimonadota bacterium]
MLALHRRWQERCRGRVYLWNELTGRFDWDLGATGSCPGHTQIQRDFQIYRKLRIMGSVTNWDTSMAAPSNLYFTGRVLWDVDLDADGLRQDFLDRYYGPAGNQMAAFFEELGEIPFGYPDCSAFRDFRPLVHHLDDPRVRQLSDHLDQAVAAARDEPYLSRVVEVRQRLQTMLAWVKLYRASQASGKILALPEAERKTRARIEALQLLRNQALPHYRHLAARRDPAATMAGAAGYRKISLSELWKPFGEEPTN